MYTLHTITYTLDFNHKGITILFQPIEPLLTKDIDPLKIRVKLIT